MVVYKVAVKEAVLELGRFLLLAGCVSFGYTEVFSKGRADGHLATKGTR